VRVHFAVELNLTDESTHCLEGWVVLDEVLIQRKQGPSCYDGVLFNNTRTIEIESLEYFAMSTLSYNLGEIDFESFGHFWVDLKLIEHVLEYSQLCLVRRLWELRGNCREAG
jgi:hypothetical protein